MDISYMNKNKIYHCFLTGSFKQSTMVPLCCLNSSDFQFPSLLFFDQAF